MKRFFKDRHNIASIVLVLVFAVIVYQLANLQLVQGENYFTQSQVFNLRSRTILAERGNIVDRYGVPIAVNSTSYYLMLMNTGRPSDELNDMVSKLVKILEKNGDKYNNIFSKYLSEKPVKFGSMLANSKDRIKVLKNATGYNFTDLNQDSDPEEIYEYFRDTIFKIDTDKYKEPEIYKIMALRFLILSNNPVVAESINEKTVAEIEERTDEFPGAIVDLVPSRKYIDAEYAAHLIGYVRTIDENELASRADEGYKPDDIIGKSGIELTAEGYLRGTNGYRRIQIDENGKTKTISEEAVKPGSDVVLTIDMRLQKVAMESLEKNIQLIRQKPQSRNFKDADAGAAVAIDVNTGEVLALASYPSYDPSIFLAGPEDKAAQKAIENLFDPKNTARPAFNRTIAGTYTPGSTFKPMVGLAGLEEKKVNPYDKYFDKGYEIYDGLLLGSIEYRTYKSGLGWVNMIQAIQKSCNPYFYNLGVKVGIDNIDKWATKFGLGQKTGIDLLGESKGILASKAYKKTYSPYIFGSADTAQSSIGQFDNSFTPIQLANYCATIANGGKHFKPHIIKRVVKYDGSIVTETKPEYELLPVKKENMKIIQEGMIAVANSEDRGGTAANAFNELLPIKVAGKTGTAETESTNQTKSSNALFICYAPADKPQIAVAVVVEKGVLGAYTAPIAKDILKAYFDNNGSNIEDIAIKSEIVELTK
ncbi:penicillin-binding protein 2 [Ruminiclostridium cellobioparum]|uniref:Penicillin-binding protein 2 n=1 Tax=Ruminiclostridium cellobioparum subsp. termitidis CT1112 TaxID=1195236 RepID=S0G037_RUMCE|nr:penicillin-binding protein 2 [Ruminiclostridium cellobioparum]EMS74173.1 penicillin-binding protein 2 [Ruminiclostridium cellobioparum subsp. termitidis CT1112]